MLLGGIADDFTGASDLANTLAKGGMRVLMSVGLPAGDTSDADAVVVALKTRSVPAVEAVAYSLAAYEWLKLQGASQIFFKYCSTFDSTPAGNIGPVAEALLDATGGSVAVFCPAFPTTGRTVFQGHLFVGDRLLSETGMAEHPLTPMTDPDLRRVLRRQTRGEVGLVPHATVAHGADAIASALAAEAEAGRRLVIVDAVLDRDLAAIGTALAEEPLVTGGSGMALGLPGNFRRAGRLRQHAVEPVAVHGPGIVLCGSCSPASHAQVMHYAVEHPVIPVDPDAVMDGRLDHDGLLQEVLAQLGREPIVYSTAAPEAVTAAQARHGREAVAAALERLFGQLAASLADAGLCRLVVGGGETSGAVIQALGVDTMRIGPEIDPGIPALSTQFGDREIALALKSGNFGAPDFFAKALAALGGQRARPA